MSALAKNLKILGLLLGVSMLRFANAEVIVDIHDKIYFTMLNPDTNETVPVYESAELYAFPWNTNVRFC
jgi:hypothetical protein